MTKSALDQEPLIKNPPEVIDYAWLDDFLTRELSQVTRIFSPMLTKLKRVAPEPLPKGEIIETEYVPSEVTSRGFTKMVVRGL